jgi:release factor glutamine methyltransferase
MILSEFLTSLQSQFASAGIDTARLDAEVLVCHVLGLDRAGIIMQHDRILNSEELYELNCLGARRAKRVPVAYLTGNKEFYSLEFSVTPDVLIPRPETEFLVDYAIYYAPQGGRVLDIGTGSGVIAIAIKHTRRDLEVYASDISEKALKVAQVNSHKILEDNGIRFFRGDCFDPFHGEQFHVIVSNPPYVDPARKNSLQKELSHEPQSALFAGDCGREIIIKIIDESHPFLYPGGVVLIEIGAEMKDFIMEYGPRRGYDISIASDYAGFARVAVLKRR